MKTEVIDRLKAMGMGGVAARVVDSVAAQLEKECEGVVRARLTPKAIAEAHAKLPAPGAVAAPAGADGGLAAKVRARLKAMGFDTVPEYAAANLVGVVHAAVAERLTRVLTPQLVAQHCQRIAQAALAPAPSAGPAGRQLSAGARAGVKPVGAAPR